ncbi:MAG: caspase family protein [Alphaproteobacteria bacterium]|nr:caspase family protein [Alphaproteobacteria bacterium]
MLRFLTGLVMLAVAGVAALPRDGMAQIPPGERRVALIVGNSAYAGGGRLANPGNDAQAIAGLLRGLGFDVEVALDAGYLDLTRAVRRFGDRIETAHVALFYYAGHGLQLAGTNFLVPVDAQLANERDVRFETVDLASIVDLMRGQTPRVNLIFLDACRDNPLARAMNRTNQTRALQGPGLAPMTASGMLIAFSTEPGSVSVDGTGDNSPFTAALLQHMPTPGLEIRQMLTRVRQSVRQATGGRQIPWDHSSLDTEFYFTGGPSTIATRGPPPDAELLFWQSIMTTGTPAELELFMRQFPNSRFAELARLRLAALRAPRAASAGVGQGNADAARSSSGEGASVATPAEGQGAAPQQGAGDAAPAQGQGDGTPPSAPATAPPSPLGPRRFASADVPFVGPAIRRQLSEYERLVGLRALALASDGTLAWRADQTPGATEADLRRQAIETCEYMAQRGCRIYAIGDRVDPTFAEPPAVPSLRIATGALDIARIPFLSAAERLRVRGEYSNRAERRALALSPTGVWGVSWGVGSERAARADALRRCEEFDGNRGLCMVYAVGDRVVESWPDAPR